MLESYSVRIIKILCQLMLGVRGSCTRFGQGILVTENCLGIGNNLPCKIKLEKSLMSNN